MYKITLSDGTVLDNIDVNGTTLISKTPVDKSMFEYKLSPVNIEFVGERNPLDMSSFEGHHENMKYIQLGGAPEGEYYFTLIDIPEIDMMLTNIHSRIEYIAMMAEIDL